MSVGIRANYLITEGECIEANVEGDRSKAQDVRDKTPSS